MHSYIVCSGTNKTRTKTVNRLIANLRQKEQATSKDFLSTTDPDLIIVKPDPTISIDTVRELKKKLKLKPFSAKSKIALITSANLLTLQAQQALLKTLEEPMLNNFLILELVNHHHLLETTRSRCQLIKAPRLTETLNKINLKQAGSIISIIQQSSPGMRIAYLDKFKKRSEALTLLNSLLLYFRYKLRKDTSWAAAAKLTHETIVSLENNVNTNLTLENFALNFPKTPKNNKP